jgi:DNA helicase II / ATP-dependent DNA helicase PcrA
MTITDETDPLLEGLNDEQREVALHDLGPCLVAACAGAGKTTAVVRRMAYLVRRRGVPADRIFGTTFSRKAAGEMNRRIKELLGSDTMVQVQTFHAYCRRVLAEEMEGFATWTLDQADQYRTIIKRAVGYEHMDWARADIEDLVSFIELAKAAAYGPGSAEAHALAKARFRTRSMGYRNPEQVMEAYATAEQLRVESRLMTFSDWMVETERLFRDESIRHRWAALADYVLIDEAQDSSLVQMLIAGHLARDHKNLMLIGDSAQCHPPGVLITTSSGLAVPIEELHETSIPERPSLQGWNRQAQRMIAWRKYRIAVRDYDGPMYSVRVADRIVPMTSNHKVLARWSDRSSDICVTYLMRREGFGFRVGWCKLFASTGLNFHLAQRAKIEKADCVWILKAHESRTDASVHESIVAARYGLPTATFEPVHGATHMAEEALRRIFDASLADGNIERGCRALADHGREADRPLWPWPSHGGDDDSVGYRRNTYFAVYAANIEPTLMSLPLPDDRNVWSPVQSLHTERYSGPVYSLDVEKDHSYAANGVVVLNSIYKWRGAMPEYFNGFPDQWGGKIISMNKNYRSGQAIIDNANQILGQMKPEDRVTDKLIECTRADAPGAVAVRAYGTQEDEARGVADQVMALHEDGIPWRDMVVLYRVNSLSRAIEEMFNDLTIPYKVTGSACFYLRREISGLLSYLKVAWRKGATMDDVRRSLFAPMRRLGKVFMSQVETASRERPGSFSELVDRAMMLSPRRLSDQQTRKAVQWGNIIDRLRASIAAADETSNPGEMIQMVVDATLYNDWLRDDEGSESPDNDRVSNVAELIRTAKKFPNVGNFLRHVETQIAVSKSHKDDDKTTDHVTLMSVHRSKGLEWRHVFIITCNDGVMPHAYADDLEEERRIYYVAATRAMDSLNVSHLQFAVSKKGERDMRRSRFLASFPEDAESLTPLGPSREMETIDAPPSNVVPLFGPRSHD